MIEDQIRKILQDRLDDKLVNIIDIAEKTDIGKSTLYRWLSDGSASMLTVNIERLCSVLNLKLTVAE